MKKSIRKAGRPVKETNHNLRDQILEAFLDLCQENSIETITLQKIADKSKVALTSVRYHFQLQGETLSRVALDYVSDKTYAYLDLSILNARKKKNFDPVKAYINAQFSWIADQPRQASFLMYYYYLCTTKVPLRVTNSELTEIGRRRVLSLIHEGIGMGLYKVVGSIVATSIDIHMYITGALLIGATGRSAEILKVQKNLSLEYADRLLRLGVRI